MNVVTNETASNVFSFLEHAARTWPNSPAIIDEGGVATFKDILESTDEIKQNLLISGVKPGSGVGIVAKNGRQFVAALFAVLGCKAVVLPLSPETRRAEIDEIARLVPLSFLMSEAISSNDDNQGRKFLIERICDDMQVAAHINNPAAIRFSSGTTGRSKGVILSHQSIGARTSAAALALNLKPGDVVTWTLPMAYHFIVSVLMYIRVGACIAVCKDTFAQTIIDVTNKNSSILLYTSPFIIRLLAADKSSGRMPSLTRVVSTSANLASDISEQFYKRFGINVCQVYGLIEVGLPLGNFENDGFETVGKALQGYEVKITNEENKDVETDEVGRLFVRGTGMFDGYLVPPQKREDIVKDGWFNTGDLATMSARGVVTVCGREKSVINTAGSKVFPEEVEEVINSFKGVKQSHVFGIPHPVFGEIAIAEIVPEDKNLEIEHLRKYCYTNLSPYKVPKEFHIIDSIPTTRTGKVIRFKEPL